MTKYAVIVDGYRISKTFFEAFQKEKVGEDDIKCISIKSRSYQEDGLFPPLDATLYVEEILYDGNLEALIKKLNTEPYVGNIIGAIGGIDSGTPLADQISHALNLPTSNGIEKSIARRDKYEMVEALKRAGVKTVTHCKSSELSVIYNFIQTLPPEKQWPIIVKPLDSGGTDNVYLCKNHAEVSIAYDSILKSKTVFEKQNEEVLVETFSQGREHIVDGVVWQGNVFFTDIWEYHKRLTLEGNPIYDYEDSRPLEGVEQQQLTSYMRDVLRALDLNNGVFHAEVMLTAEGPVLVEVANRICGCKTDEMYRKAYGISPFELTVYCYAAPEKLIAVFEKGTPKMEKTIRQVELAYEGEEGVIDTINFQAEFDKQQWQSVQPFTIGYKVGDTIKKTTNLLTSAISIVMIHENSEIVEDEMARLKIIMQHAFITAPALTGKAKTINQPNNVSILAEIWQKRNQVPLMIEWHNDNSNNVSSTLLKTE